MVSTARMDELRKKFDENPRRYFAPLANEYRKVGDLEQAIFICQEYLPQQPGHMSGHIVYGQALFESGRQDEARAVFETALALDPENLIALRHLGDIATSAGDLESARQWYKRVLEADPRNEEIAALIQSLPPAATAVETTSQATAQVVEAQSLAQSDERSPEPSQSSTGDVRASVDGLDIEHASAFDSAATIEVESPVARDTGVPAIEHTLDLEISIPGLAADAALGHTEPPIEMAEPGSEPPASTPDHGLLDFEDFAIPGPAASAHDGLPLSDPYGGVLGAEPPEQPAVLEIGDDALSNSGPPLGEVEFSGELASLDASTVEAFAGDLAGSPTWIEEPTTAPAASVPEAFVTETMAELYLRQGHITEALDLYDRLLAQRPYDDGLAARAAAARQQALGGPTIREFLGSIFHPNRSGATAAGGAPNGGIWPEAPAPSAEDERIASALARGFGSGLS